MDAGEVEVGGGVEHHSTYVLQLHQVFCSCDPSESGRLGRPELTELCAQLHLDDQTNLILDHLLGDDPEAKVDFDEFKDKFVFLLAQSVDNEVQSEEESIHCASPVAEREVSPKYFNGKKYGRRSRPDLDSNDTDNDFTSDFSDTEVFISNPPDNKSCSNEHLDTGSPPGGATVAVVTTASTTCNASNARTRVPSGNQVTHQGAKRRRRMKSHEDNAATPIDSNRRAEALESLQQGSTFDFFDRDSLAGDNSENEEDYLKTIWLKLGVGTDGFLNQKGLTRVCEYIGMEKMAEEVISQLFEKLDVDQDGKISFGEFLHLFRNGHNSNTGHHSITPTAANTSPNSSPSLSTIVIDANDKNSDSNRNYGKSAPVSPKDHQSSKDTICNPGIFSCIDNDGSGYADPEMVVELWESLGVSRGYRLLEAMGFNCACQICLLDLSNVLEDILQSSSDSDYSHVAFLSFQHELKFLKKSLEQMTIERDKLRADVTDANSRATMLAQEVDDHHAKLEKTSNNKIMAIEKKFQEQARHLKDELDHEREQLHLQMTKIKKSLEEEVVGLRDAEIAVREQLALTQKENQHMENEMRALSAKLNESLKLNQQRQLEAESLLALKEKASSEDRCKLMADQLEVARTENKQLKDQNDELHAELESLRQVASRLHATGSGHSTGPPRPLVDCEASREVDEEEEGEEDVDGSVERLLAGPTGGMTIDDDGAGEDAQVVPTVGGARHRRNGSWMSDYVRHSSTAIKKRGGGGPLNSSSEELSDEESSPVGKRRGTISGSLSRDKSRSEDTPTLVLMDGNDDYGRPELDPRALSYDGLSLHFDDDDEYFQLNPAPPPPAVHQGTGSDNNNASQWEGAVNKLAVKKVFAVLRRQFIEEYERELEEERARAERRLAGKSSIDGVSEHDDYFALPPLSTAIRRKLSDSGCDSVLDSQSNLAMTESARTNATPRCGELADVAESWWNRKVDSSSQTPDDDTPEPEVEISRAALRRQDQVADRGSWWSRGVDTGCQTPEVEMSRVAMRRQDAVVEFDTESPTFRSPEPANGYSQEPEIVTRKPEKSSETPEVWEELMLGDYQKESDLFRCEPNDADRQESPEMDFNVPEVGHGNGEGGEREMSDKETSRKSNSCPRDPLELHEVYQQELQSMDGRWKSILQAEKENWGNLVRNMERQYQQLKVKLTSTTTAAEEDSIKQRRDVMKGNGGFWRGQLPEQDRTEDETEAYDAEDAAEGLPDKIERTQLELERMLQTGGGGGGGGRKSRRGIQRQSAWCHRHEAPPLVGYAAPLVRQAGVIDYECHQEADDEDNGAISWRKGGNVGLRKMTSLGRSKSWRENGCRKLTSVEKRRFRFKRQGLHTGSSFEALCLDVESPCDHPGDYVSDDDNAIDYCGDSDYEYEEEDYDDDDDDVRNMRSRVPPPQLQAKSLSCAKTRFYENRLRNTEKQKQSLERELGKVYNELLICKTSTGSSGKYGSGGGNSESGAIIGDCGKSNCVIDVEVLHSINQHLKQQEKRCRQLEAALKTRHLQSERALRDTRQGYEEELERAAHLLHKTRILLKEQTTKAKEQGEKLLQSDTLVKDLYIENAQLMKTLQFLEEKQHKYEKNNFALQQKCSALNQLLAEMCRLPPT